jgi:hypothetical protein
MSFEEDTGIIHCLVKGPLDNSSALPIISEAINLGRENNCVRFFYDFRKARLKMTTMELYLLPRAFEYEKNHRCAVLIRKNYEAENWRFFETVGRNLGIEIRMFVNESKAKTWLTTR